MGVSLAVMSARVIAEASITVSLDGRTPDRSAIIEDTGLSTALRFAIEALDGAARKAIVSSPGGAGTAP
jgi:hypothetical protein